MDVRCERCRAQYVFDDEQVTPSGLAVQCTRCGHVFRVKKKELVVTVPVKPGELDGVPLPATAAAPRPGGGRVAEHGSASAEAERRAWRVRRASGDVLTLHEPTALQRWVVERRVSRDDELSEAGGPWRRLGDLAELEAFFQVVEAAARVEVARAAREPSPPAPPAPVAAAPGQVSSLQPAAPAPSSSRAAPAPSPLAPEDVALGDDELVAVRRGRGPVVAVVALLGVAIAAAAYAFSRPARRPAAPAAPPAAITVPLTIEVPSAPAPATPAPAPAPDGRAAPDAPAPDEPAGAAREAPASPEALLARADRLRERNHAEQALEVYARVLEAEPRNAGALAGRGLCYLDLERYDSAEASFRAALKTEPGQPDALMGLAETYRGQGRRPEALQYYERYLALHPDGEDAAVVRNAIDELRR
jgi:predicted Zn finger-like uncharacterized protein